MKVRARGGGPGREGGRGGLSAIYFLMKVRARRRSRGRNGK